MKNRSRFRRSIQILVVACTAASSIQPLIAGNGDWTLIGWNNLGMHCMDDDYSVFTILPPFNTINAQLIDASGQLLDVPGGITVTYEAMADPDGSINSTVVGKSNFWEHAEAAYGAAVPLEWGLAGTRMPGPENTPQPMTWDATFRWFEGTGIPITPLDDAFRTNPYPMFRLVARDSGGSILAETHVVLPVSSEMDCRACHASGSGAAARPTAGWVNDPNDKRDFRLNILRLHDENHSDDLLYQSALASFGWPAEGLYAAVTTEGSSILCAKCHLSEALPDTGLDGIPPLTEAIHSRHAWVTDPESSLLLNSITNRGACYTCHPGSATRCLRGAMGSAIAEDGTLQMQCQSCHGQMSDVGSDARIGWFDEPNCQQCHTGSATLNSGEIRYASVFESGSIPRVPASNLFGTNPDTPVSGVSLYRFSSGHGGLQCSACHGSTHAEFPASHRNDNLQSAALQGHVGVLADCIACHATMPVTVSDGPHGMHPVGDQWISVHKEYGESADCQACHGAEYRGTVLSRMFGDRTLVVDHDLQVRSIEMREGQTVGCFLCHKREDDGRLGGVFTNNHAPIVENPVLLVAKDAPAGLSLSCTDSDGNTCTVRVLQQPLHGSVALTESNAIYYPMPGYVGPDSFSYVAFDGYAESTPGIVSVMVGNPPENLDSDHDTLSDLFEYALGLSPDFPTVYTTPTVVESGGQMYLQMQLPKGLLPMDADVVIEVSSDLHAWTPANLIEGGRYELAARDPIAVESAARRFIRARVIRPIP